MKHFRSFDTIVLMVCSSFALWSDFERNAAILSKPHELYPAFQGPPSRSGEWPEVPKETPYVLHEVDFGHCAAFADLSGVLD